MKVTYTLEMDGKFFIIKNVPARVCEETGEQFFSPETVERLQQTILDEGSRRKQSKHLFTSLPFNPNSPSNNSVMKEAVKHRV